MGMVFNSLTWNIIENIIEKATCNHFVTKISHPVNWDSSPQKIDLIELKKLCMPIFCSAMMMVIIHLIVVLTRITLMVATKMVETKMVMVITTTMMVVAKMVMVIRMIPYQEQKP